jgi:hypothetical protein
MEDEAALGRIIDLIIDLQKDTTEEKNEEDPKSNKKSSRKGNQAIKPKPNSGKDRPATSNRPVTSISKSRPPLLVKNVFNKDEYYEHAGNKYKCRKCKATINYSNRATNNLMDHTLRCFEFTTFERLQLELRKKPR